MKPLNQFNRKQQFLICCVLFLVIIIVMLVIGFAVGSGSAGNSTAETEAPTQAPTMPKEYQMDGVKVIPQHELMAGCETYACTMMLQILGFDMDEKTFAEKYLITKPITYVDYYYRYGPDMYSAQAGDVYTGYGVYAPAMAKSINLYFDKIGETRRAYALEGVSLEELCEKYVWKGMPVMVWATTWMEESYEKESWIVDYVDENARCKIGDTFTWKQNEHCLVLIGYDDEEYYFADSCAGKIANYERSLVEERYSQLYSQSIVVE